MSLTIQDYLAKNPKKPADRQTRDVALVHVSDVIQTVTAHPGWQLFLAHVETLQERHRLAFNAAKDAVISDPDPIQREAGRQEALRLSGYLQALHDLMDLMPELIRRGERASQALLAL